MLLIVLHVNHFVSCHVAGSVLQRDQTQMDGDDRDPNIRTSRQHSDLRSLQL